MTLHKLAKAVGEITATNTVVKEEMLKIQARLTVLGDFLDKADRLMREALEELGPSEPKSEPQEPVK